MNGHARDLNAWSLQASNVYKENYMHFLQLRKTRYNIKNNN